MKKLLLSLSCSVAAMGFPGTAWSAALPVTAGSVAIGADKTPALVMPAEKPVPKYLNPADLMPLSILPQPAARGSEMEAGELVYLHVLVADATPERLAQAAQDGNHEDPSLFNEALGRNLTKLPATWAFLVTIQDETEALIDISKDTFRRMRPYDVDATLPTCVKVSPHQSARSYPSGHAGVSYSVGWALARLVPDKAPAILARAQDYALSRELCGVHFASDIEASHVLATVIADRLLADPRLANQMAAARAELTGK